MKRLRRPIVLFGFAVAAAAARAVPGAPSTVERWGMWEASFQGPSNGNPYAEVAFSAVFQQNGRAIEVPGFWDGGGVYWLRFSPPSEGIWRYRTRSNRPELDGIGGTLTAGPPSASIHGPVEVFDTFHFRYADGTPHHSFGTTCYAWIHQPEELQAATLRTLAAKLVGLKRRLPIIGNRRTRFFQ